MRSVVTGPGPAIGLDIIIHFIKIREGDAARKHNIYRIESGILTTGNRTKPRIAECNIR